MRQLIDLQRKLHGYHGTYRGKFLLLQRKILTKEEFILYDASLSFADWDKDKSTYGTFDLSQLEIQLLLGFSEGYVSKYSKKLFQLHFWEERDDGRILVSGFKLTEAGLLKELARQNLLIDPDLIFANQQSHFEKQPTHFANKQTASPKRIAGNQPYGFANQQSGQPKSDTVSYKDENIDDSGLSEEDKKWIDENLKESGGSL
ncbi:hypothetical protein C5B42_00710 [Candidatus Cerribacteria bacterium 'Amazon FNV 2010 28 9']|uniref:Uncharacterized protein n=1 Tax=Candidatus Cerribacteria bacterium 'Amazon FNV 2010 28 9' TaxID=2081795 RepID=A0A317JQ75_9BACT|nr:MAG: hypothetical protein C5B42_00710 [Candidatus Cerribacteria bacterium 'Amazon FNV 2010 28 9']